MKYVIKYSFHLDNVWSGPAGRIIDEELYNRAIEAGLGDRVGIEGYVPATFRTDEELDNEIAGLLAEREKREYEKSKIVDVEVSTKEATEEVPQETKKRGRPQK